MRQHFIRFLFFAVLLSGALTSTAQVGRKEEKAPYTIIKTVDMPGMKKEKVYKTGVKWVNKLDDTKMLRYNESMYIYEAKSRLPYENDIVLEDIFLSPDAALRTKGWIYYTIRITAEDEKLTVEFTDFKHEAFISRYGKISFGLIMKSEKVPLGKCYENAEWCNAVWKDMKKKCVRHVTKVWMETKEKLEK